MKVNSFIDFSYKHSINRIMRPNQHIFDFYSIKDKNKIGTLVCHKSEIPLRSNYNGNILAIDFLKVTNKNEGWGTKILKFAQEYSKKIGCDGYMIIKADSSYTPERIPHIFYRKFGFSTLMQTTDKKLDEFIKNRKNATKNDFPCLIMHYPPSINIKHTQLKKIVSYFKELFRYVL